MSKITTSEWDEKAMWLTYPETGLHMFSPKATEEEIQECLKYETSKKFEILCLSRMLFRTPGYSVRELDDLVWVI